MSKTYSLAIIGIITTLAPVFGFEISDTKPIEEIVAAVILIGIAVDRLLKKDISILGIRKK